MILKLTDPRELKYRCSLGILLQCFMYINLFAQPFWKNAESLKTGDLILMVDGSVEVIKGVKSDWKNETVFNFSVDGLHNYYISDVGVLVHNNDCNVDKIKDEASLNVLSIAQPHWKNAEEIDKDDILLLADGTIATVESIEINSSERMVFNFEVADDHNYYVSPKGILVHNGGLDCLREIDNDLDRYVELDNARKKGEFYDELELTRVKKRIEKNARESKINLKERLEKQLSAINESIQEGIERMDFSGGFVRLTLMKEQLLKRQRAIQELGL